MDKKEALKQIKAGDFYLGSADDKFKSDKEVVLAAVKKSGSDLEYADKKLRADDEDVKDTITYDDINFSDSRGIGSTAYDTNNKEITEYDEFQGGGDTEVIYLNSTYKPTEITVNFKSKESVIFDNVNSENENYTVKITGETIGVLKNYSDVLMVVRTLLGK